MPLGPVTIIADPGGVGDALRDRLALTPTSGDTADVVVCEGIPSALATHVVLTGALTDEVDAWDEQVAPQTVAGALWLTDQPDAADAAVAWLTLRLQMPTTPLSDLPDSSGRALRWSVAAGITVAFPDGPQVQVDPAEVKAWADARPEVRELGEAVQRLGGESGEAVLASVQRFRDAVAGLAELGATEAPIPQFEAAVAEHLAQVQRTGFARWRRTKARSESQSALQDAGRAVAAQRLAEVLEARETQVAGESQLQLDVQSKAELLDTVASAIAELKLPVTPDFDKVSRSWSTSAPQPRRYVFVNEEHLALFDEFPHTVRPADLPTGQALCALVQSGFSLPALR